MDSQIYLKLELNPLPHTTILQQTTLNIFCQNMENPYNWKDNLWLKVESIVAKGEIARFEQFLLLSLCFQKAICWRGVRKRLYEGKDKYTDIQCKDFLTVCIILWLLSKILVVLPYWHLTRAVVIVQTIDILQ